VPAPSGCEHIPTPGQPHPLHLAFAIADHPWVDSADGAAVRIAMTVAAPGVGEGRLLAVTAEREGSGEGLDVELAERTGTIHADLTIGANVAASKALRANERIGFRGVTLMGSGFWVEPNDSLVAREPKALKPLRNGRDLTDRPREVFAIDFYGLNVEEARARYPAAFQRVLDGVKPERDQSQRAAYRAKWWLFAEARPDLRDAISGEQRYIATPMTSKHRTFQFLDGNVLPDQGLIAIALDDGYYLGVISSCVHIVWALAQGGTLEDRPRYNNSRCFETFPFPAAIPEQQVRIRNLAEQLDAHRKRVLAEQAELTLTGLYNVLEKLRHDEPLTAKDKLIHERGLVAVMRSLHDELDAAVLDAYGWQDRPDDATLLERLVALNAERAAEEVQGTIRWLRPEFQNPQPTQASMAGMEVFRPTICDSHEEVGMPPSPPAPKQTYAPQQWPQQLPDQVAAVALTLATAAAPLTLEDLAAHFKGKGPWKKRLPQLLDTLVVLGKARVLEDGRWMG
ncbi:MAG: class I SAM-dependent DNA methyltransferase, partial [Proteobacteria bacterium]|nr:class I SAM-dependent DNA methyltransferase [Pseudomonadota bacterium]